MPYLLAAVDFVPFVIAAAIVLAVVAAVVTIVIVTVKRGGKAKQPKQAKEPKRAAKPQTTASVLKPVRQSRPELTVEAVNTDWTTQPVKEQPAPAAVQADETQPVQPSVAASVAAPSKPRFILVRYSKSFTAKLMQADDVTKQYYSDLKNCLLAYKGIKNRVSWRWETFRYGRKPLVKMRLRGKTLSLAFALNAQDYDQTRYLVEDISHVGAYAATPCLYRIKNDRRARYAKQLIADVAASCNAQVDDAFQPTNYVGQLPYKSVEALIAVNLVKELTTEEVQDGTRFDFTMVRKSVSASEADKLLQDDVAATLVRRLGGTTDKSCVAIVNIDTLSQTFEDGDVVTLDDVKHRVKGFNGKATYLKVLARGVLDKRLIVHADSFSPQAVKMIALTGGESVKK